MSRIDKLRKLAGMAFHGGKSVSHWIDTVGVDPSKVDGISVRGNLCYWTSDADSDYRKHLANVRLNFQAIGVR